LGVLFGEKRDILVGKQIFTNMVWLVAVTQSAQIVFYSANNIKTLKRISTEVTIKSMHLPRSCGSGSTRKKTGNKAYRQKGRTAGVHQAMTGAPDCWSESSPALEAATSAASDSAVQVDKDCPSTLTMSVGVAGAEPAGKDGALPEPGSIVGVDGDWSGVSTMGVVGVDGSVEELELESRDHLKLEKSFPDCLRSLPPQGREYGSPWRLAFRRSLLAARCSFRASILERVVAFSTAFLSASTNMKRKI
jgi:hypothetical protein